MSVKIEIPFEDLLADVRFNEDSDLNQVLADRVIDLMVEDLNRQFFHDKRAVAVKLDERITAIVQGKTEQALAAALAAKIESKHPSLEEQISNIVKSTLVQQLTISRGYGNLPNNPITRLFDELFARYFKEFKDQFQMKLNEQFVQRALDHATKTVLQKVTGLDPASE